jgi:hypothetical protein
MGRIHLIQRPVHPRRHLLLGVENEESIKTDRTLVIRLTDLPVMLVDSPRVGSGNSPPFRRASST